MPDHQARETREDRRLREEKQREHQQDYTHPEKHYVRKHAWVPAASARLRKVGAEGRGEYVKYFTLCAKEAIDVFLFALSENLIELDAREFPGVVFCECYPDQYELIKAKLGRTRGFLARFEDLVLNRDTPESEDFYSELPFDLYNLDFTGVCFPRTEPPFSRTLEAIVDLIETSGSEPYRQGFDMFLTFRARRSEENEAAIRRLKNNIRDNRNQYQWYEDAFAGRYGENLGLLLDGKYHEFLLRALPKLLGRFGKQAGFCVACSHSVCYPRPDPQNPRFYIISFGLSFDWAGQDTGLGRSVRQTVPSQEIATDAYLAMLRQITEQDIQNVGTMRFARSQYEQEVVDLLAATRGL